MTISKERLDKIKAIKDEEIDTSDIPELDDQFWDNAKVVMPKPRKTIALDIDVDVFNWFNSLNNGFENNINSALRKYMENHLQDKR